VTQAETIKTDMKRCRLKSQTRKMLSSPCGRRPTRRERG
jgi:hypothetical protein